VALQKITGPDPTDMTAFVVVDLDGAPAADGVVRAAKKILVDGARTMARSRTYAWALLGEQRSGASAGVSVDPNHQAAGVSAFVDAVREQVASGALSLDPGKGVSNEDLAGLTALDARGGRHLEPRDHGTLAEELLAASARAAAESSLGALSGCRVAVEGAGTALPALLGELLSAGASVVAVGSAAGALVETGGVDVAAVMEAFREHGDDFAGALGSDAAPAAVLGAEADVLMCGSKLGLIDHQVADLLAARVVVPVGPAPVTAKGLAVARRRDVVVMADFLTASGPLQAYLLDGEPDGALRRARDHSTRLSNELSDHPDGPYLAACYRAEDFLRTWRDTLPFGRPLA
jgi:glutamate dehydrogenase (NAD(P)+)